MTATSVSWVCLMIAMVGWLTLPFVPRWPEWRYLGILAIATAFGLVAIALHG